MSVNLYKAPSAPFTAKLDGRLASTDTVMVLNTAVGLQAPGVIVVERIDLTTDLASTKKEFMSYTGVSANTVTGLDRGLAGTTAADHNSGSLVECYFSVDHWTDLQNNLLVEHTSADGTHKFDSHARTFQFTGVSGVSGLKGDVIIVPGSLMLIDSVSGVSGYNAVRLNTVPKYHFPFLSLPTYATVGTNKIQVIAENDVTLKSVSFVVKTPNSNATTVIDINKNNTSIFTDQTTRPMLAIGATYVSTASIGTISISKGDIISLDIDE